jgi:hypothetical protein
MPMPLEGLHLLVTYRCTWECEHCFVWGGPDNESTMTLAQSTDVIDQAAQLGTVDHVYFEGGEPTLAYPVVLKAAAHARSRGLDVGLVTNCFWALDEQDAEVWLAPFAELGIFDLSVSTYPFFGLPDDAVAGSGGGSEQEGGPATPADATLLENAIRAARRLGIPVAALEVGAAADLSAVGLSCGDPDAIMYRGRAAVELAPAAAHRPPESLVACPFEDLDAPQRAHLGADGELQVCQGLSAGNLWRDGLRSIVDAYDPHDRPVFRELLAGGPIELARSCGLQPLRELYADECHLCYELRERLRERFPEVLVPDACYGPAAGAGHDADHDDETEAGSAGDEGSAGGPAPGRHSS